MKNYLKIINTRRASAGFTLIELLVAMSITTIVVTIAGSGLIAIMQNNNKAEAETLRRIELNRALDFIMDEIRTARRINTTTTTTTKAGNAVVASNTAILFSQTSTASTSFSPALGIDLNNSSARDKIVLYLEIPITGNIPPTCPTGTDLPNPGKAPPSPSTYDRVVYDIRSSTSTWLNPRTINRYGRIPRIDGTINPCSSPQASEALIDSISDTNINPTCTSLAVRSGAEGFYACVNGRLVELYLRSKVTASENYDLKSKGFSRIAP